MIITEQKALKEILEALERTEQHTIDIRWGEV